MKSRLLTVLALALMSIGVTAAAGPADPRYGHAEETPDGIGKTYQGREIAQVMGWQAASWLEREEREQEERGTVLLKELRLKPGMVVADVGAGSGYYARRIAPLLGPQGRVLAVDVQPEMIALLNELAKDRRNGHIEPVLGSSDDVKLQPGSLDLALMVDVYHELEYPYEMLESIVRALKPGGRIVFVEYRGEDARVPIKALHKMTERQIRLEAGQHALEWERTAERLPWQHMVFFTKKSP